MQLTIFLGENPRLDNPLFSGSSLKVISCLWFCFVFEADTVEMLSKTQKQVMKEHSFSFWHQKGWEGLYGTVGGFQVVATLVRKNQNIFPQVQTQLCSYIVGSAQAKCFTIKIVPLSRDTVSMHIFISCDADIHKQRILRSTLNSWHHTVL